MSEAVTKNFIEQFCSTFELYSYGNSLYGRLCAHLLLGQKLKNIKIYFGPYYIDPRVSFFLIQPSGTGKSVPWGFIKKVGEGAGLMLDDIDIATDAALVGSEEAEEVIDPETKQKTITHNVIKGKLAEADILHYDEGQMLVQRVPYAENTLGFFQKALNPIVSGQNVIKKYLKHAEIEIAPTCSLMITSHEIENLLEIVLNKGFFQRIILYPRYVPIDDRKKNEFLRADRFGKRLHTEIDIETLSTMLNAVGKKYEEWEVKVDDDVRPVVKQKIEELYLVISKSHEKVREIMATFCPRYDNLIYILALHNACVNNKEKIDIEDIKYGAMLVYQLFREVMSWVEENINLIKLSSHEQTYLNRAYMIYKAMEQKDGFVMEISFKKNCQSKWRVSMHTVNRYFEKFKGYGNIEEIDVDGVKKIKVKI